ncbi:MAG: T9SS type A sorting domain-containing protein [Candidatus Marinimicrobia bacterium]|nr:T9SS type A sorting domain-containing protein [Candidatus Neomarinimicrobiota bacterium]
MYLSGDEEINWSVSDPENDDVSVTLEYKTKYEDWHVIADNLENAFIWETNYFANTTDGVLRLRASDGFNETVAMLPHHIYISNQRDDLICVDHINGASNANVSLATVDPNLCNQHQYEIRFYLTDSLRFSVYDLTNNQTVLENLVYYDNLNETPVFDGLTISIENSSFGYKNALSGWITGNSNWTYDLTENVTYPFPSCYEVRFTSSGSVDTNGVQVPFEVWNISYGYQSDFIIVVQNETMYYFGIYEEDQLGVEDIHWAVVIKAPSDTVSVPPVTGDILYLHVNSSINDDDVYQFTNQFVGVDRERYVPSDFQLYQNYPNPFNPSTTINFELPKPAFTEITVYDLAGRLVEKLVNERKSGGKHKIIWNAHNMPSGIYLYQIKTKDFTKVNKCVLLK